MDLGIAGRVALVTAASKGLGRATATALADEGAKVTICARGEDPLKEAEQDLAAKTAALLTAVAWAPFFPALATSGTAVEDEPGHLPRVAGVPPNLIPATLVPAIAAVGYRLHRRGL